MKGPSGVAPLRRRYLITSIALAVLVWIVLIASYFGIGPKFPGKDGRAEVGTLAIGFPLVYCGWLAMAGGFAELARQIEKSDLGGPFKDWQMRMIPAMVWGCSAAIVLLPAVILVVLILGLAGILPVQR